MLVGPLAAAGFLAFLPRLRHDAAQPSSGPVFGVVDNHPVHRAKAVDRVVDSPPAALRLSRLPASAPQPG